MSNKNKIVDIIENAIEDFSSKWSSHTEKSEGISLYADQILQLEVPDRESELIEILESIIQDFECDYVLDGEIVDQPYNWLIDRYKEAKKLIQSVKQPK